MLRAKLVADLNDYRWSSYPVYARGAVDPLVDEDPYYAPLGATSAARQRAYREFVRLDSPYAPVLDTHFLDTAF